MNYSFKYLKLIIFPLILLIIGGNTLARANNTTSTEEENKTWSITKLMESLSIVGKGTAKFQEERHISFLNEPLISKGNIRFHSPDYLFKHTETPKDERLVVFEDKVTITNLSEGHQRSYSLNDIPQLRGLLDGIRYTLAGNIDELKKSYELTLNGSEVDWQINLSPKLRAVQRLIKIIAIFGKGNQIFKVEISESNGDRTVMHIQPILK